MGVDRRITSFRVSGSVTDNYDAYTAAQTTTTTLRGQSNDPSLVNASSAAHDPHLTQLYHPMATLEFIYESKTGNVFTPQALADIRAIENRFLSAAGYSGRCLMEYKDSRLTPSGYYPIPASQRVVQCAPPNSAMNLFYPTLNASETRHYSLYDIYDFGGNGSKLYSIPDITNFMTTYDAAAWYVSRNFTMWNQTSSVLRTLFTFGAPVGTSASLTPASLVEQEKAFAEWIKPFTNDFKEWSTSNVRLLWQGTAITDHEVSKLIERDSLFCIGSVLLVLFWMIFHVRSVVLAMLGMLNILASIPVGHFVTHIIMGNKYLGLLMTLPIFIIIGIGCDDIFVFYDAWRASASQGANISSQLLTRLDWTYRRAVSSMIVTSITSAATFFIAATSPISPIRLFGIAMGSTILGNLFLATTFFPAVLVLWHRYLEHRFTWGNSLTALSELWWKPHVHDERTEAQMAEQQVHNPTSIIVSMTDVEIVQDVKDGEDLPPQPLPELELDKHPYFSKRKKTTTNSFSDNSPPDSPVGLEHDSGEDENDKSVRVVSQTNSGVKMIIELDEEPLPDPWKFNISGRYFYFNFAPFVQGLSYLVLLVALILLIFCFAAAFYLEPARGNPRFFPVGSNLNDFTDLTDNVFNLADTSYAEVNLVWGISGINRADVDMYDPNALGTTVYDKTFDLADPFAQTFLAGVYDSARVAHVGNSESQFLVNRNMQLHKSFINAFKMYRDNRGLSFPIANSSDFWTSLKSWLQSDDGDIYNTQLGWTSNTTSDSQTLLWCSMSFRSPVFPATATNSELNNFLNGWTNFMVAQNLKAPGSAMHGFATCSDFGWVELVKALVEQASWGTLGAIIVAFFVLLAVTWNVLVSFYAMLCIGMVVMEVVGFMSVAGWNLGIMEFVSLTIVAGLSIGSTVHLSVAYINYSRHSMLKDKPRVNIVQYALAEMAAPLLSGAVTTATAVIMLFFCDIVLFSHFGKFMFVNIVAALFTSFFLLVTLLLLFGPRGDFGSIHAIVAWNRERQRRNREKKRLKERLASAKSLDNLKHNHNYAEDKIASPDDPNASVEMSPMRPPSRLDMSVMSHGLSLNDSTSSLHFGGSGTPLRASVSIDDFELRLDDDDHGIPPFDLDASLSRSSSHSRPIDAPGDEEEDEITLSPVQPGGPPQPHYGEDDEDDEDVEDVTHIQT